MSTHQSADLDSDLLSFCLDSLHRNAADCGKTACTADPETSFCFGIHVDHTFSFENAAVKSYCSKKSDFLVYSDQNFQCRMRDICAVQKCQCISNSDSVITTKCGSICAYISVLDRKVQSVFLEIMLYIRTFLAYHIHMTLKDHSRCILISGSCRFVDDNVIQFILYIIKSMILRKIHQIITDLLCIAGTMRNLTDFFKIIKYSFWFTVF